MSGSIPDVTGHPESETALTWGDVKRLALAVAGGIAAVALLVAAWGPAVRVGVARGNAVLAWIIPIASAAVIAGVGWYLLRAAPRHTDAANGYESVACTSCGRAVLTDWRLCPYCGSALAPAAASPDELARG